jgi:hypothetical protein
VSDAPRDIEFFGTSPETVGELRRRLEALGRPWRILPYLNDDDPLPDPARGGQPVEPGHVEGLPQVNSQEEFDAVLREVPQTNPFLASRWRTVEATAGEAQHGEADGDEAVPEWGVG